MNNKKTRWLAALTAVILSSSTALTAFADSVPTTTQQTVADADQQTTTGETTDAVNDSNSDDKTESSTAETKNNDSDKKTELIQVEVEDKIPTMNSSYQSSWEKAKSIDTYETNPSLFTFGDVKGADGKVIANECSVSLTANASLSSGKSVVKFPETDSNGRKVTQIGNCSGAEFYELIEGLIIPNSVTNVNKNSAIPQSLPAGSPQFLRQLGQLFQPVVQPAATYRLREQPAQLRQGHLRVLHPKPGGLL